MKKLSTLSLFLLIALGTFAQNMNVQSAANSLKDNDLPMAKLYIDKAAENEQTSNNYKMWYYRGKVYLAIMSDTLKSVRDSDKDASEKSTISFINCLKTDKSGWFKEEVNDLVWNAGLGLYNSAVDAYNVSDYERANRHFKLIFDVFPLDPNKNLKRNNITPEVVYKNLYMVANKAGDFKVAKENLQKLMDMDYNDPLIYLYMERLYLDEKDTAKALSYLEKGRARFDENVELMNEELNIYISQGRMDVLVGKFTAAIEINPESEVLYFNRGTIYEKKKDFVNAEADYKKALEINSEYFDAAYNMGAMIFNQGAEMANAANAILDNKKFDEAKKKADAKLQESLPFLEKAYELSPKDRNTLISLKQLYARVNNQVKYEKIKIELDNLK